MIDIHSHILFGIDDGPKTIEESIAMLRIAHEDGIQGMFATSHYFTSKYEHDEEKTQGVFSELSKRIEEEGLPIKIYPGNEAFLDEHLLEGILKGKCRTLNDSRYVLIEIFNNMPILIVKKMLFDIQIKGYIPIIAHCERLITTKKDCEKILELKEMGVFLQVNANTLFKKKELWFRRWLIKGLKKNLISFISSDAHNTIGRRPELRLAFDFVQKKAGQRISENIFIHNPQRVIENEDLS